jgi:hypothetical protein
MSQEATGKDISTMSPKELAEYLNLPYELVYNLTCNWHSEVLGQWACMGIDGYNWIPKRIILLNAFPLSAFSSAMNVKIYPTNARKLLEFLAQLPHEYVCYVGHQPTSLLIEKYIPTKCTRSMYSYNPSDEVLVAFVLKARPNTSGVDINVSLDDLAAYIILPSPLS